MQILKSSYKNLHEICITQAENFLASFKLLMQILANLNDNFEICMGAKGPSGAALFPSLLRIFLFSIMNLSMKVCMVPIKLME